MSHLSRRSLVASAATLPALAVPVLGTAASPSDDAILRDLWSEYLVRAAAYDAVSEKYNPARAAWEAEFPPCPDDVVPADHSREYRWLWDKHGLEVLCDAINEAGDRMHDVIEKILATKATGLFGIGVKLAALPSNCRLGDSRSSDPQDYIESVASVLSDINRLIGTDFASMEDDETEE